MKRLFGIWVLIVLMLHSGTSDASASSIGENLEGSAVSYADIEANATTMTDVQFQNYARGITGNV
jgi:hypothetical protein